MPNFLVVSYDPDQQQWFYDTVESANAEMAKAYILKLRDYVTDSDAHDLASIGKMGEALARKAVNDTSDPLCECQDCGHVCPESELDAIQDLHERVAAGEIMPAGECPECHALSSLVPTEEVYRQ